MKRRNLIVIIVCFLFSGCLQQFRGVKLETQARSHMEHAAALEDSSLYHQAAQEYAIVAERYPSTGYYKRAVWKTALLNMHPDNSKIDYSTALFWLKVYLGLSLSPEEKEDAALYVAMLEHVNGLQAELSSYVAEKDKLLEVTQKQSSDIVTGTRRLKELEAELAQAQDELKKMKEVDVRMQRSKNESNSNNSLELLEKPSKLNNDEEDTQQLSRPNALKPQDFFPYTIQISSRKNKEASILEAMKSRDKGHSGFVSHAYIPGKGDWYRIFVGFYRTFEEAEKAAVELKKQEYPLAFVVKMPFAIQVGISSKDEELKQLDAALRLKGYLAYSVLDRLYNNKIRLLVGAFRTEKEAAIFAEDLQKEGFEPKVVQR
ncbi:MAG: SPOR domain-containing protein [Deltaproteobacteria bacterium]|nr:SPOR domain-containing protein [Deltaproteobacteria bacterium]MBW2013201.1 SPOR domain-containing protein [Deltaproteobacteria bacterium]MBW2090068.1 SPOR domain-containing protein [Deltaproteobacteria bacterium]